ncbi:GPI-anchored cell wall organization protein Ecm33 [Lindgomyces ingoldianus]|uniref:GPI-anchored cell wall organization protein Ecm33 n=1 Tax=Lindgomyces ingoldianus TaxID=673940 RepID=A0ACB6QLX0_9PLEO|nr:GPI-anchored cell wall organization protein Ecm33 [Lindgomyces ingoldianus]KAF2467122.1 GPI-anchored cell wall organization protein Ecm33 [Lindgomyces ingoldianus]
MSPMMRIVLPALAVASTAFGIISKTATSTIQNSGDATALASCKTFSGSIAISTGTSDPIALDGVEKIDGNLACTNNSAIQSISGGSLSEITGQFLLDTVQVLNTVNFPKLATVDSLKWNALPNLQTLQFNNQITKASKIDIQNTQLQSLQGINIKSVDTLYIANNRYISDISMQLGNVTSSLTLEANNPEVNVTFPNLIWAFNMTFRNCSSVEVPSLESLNGSMGFYGNVLTSFSAPNLTKIGGALAFVSNTEMTNISLPLLTEVSANLQIANNTKLGKIDGLPQLKTIGGALDFNGNMSDIQIPQLNDVKGAFNLQSTGDVQKECDDFFKPLKNKGKIQGKFVCVGSVAKPGGEGTTPTVTGASAKKTGAASTLNVQSNAAMGLMGLAAAFFL